MSGPAVAQAPHLVRLRANPAIVRVAIRRVRDRWRVKVSAQGIVFFATREQPEQALAAALAFAHAHNLPGLDLDCQWAYPHPQGRPPVAPQAR